MASTSKQKAQEQEETTYVVTPYGTYARLEYIRNWKKIKKKQNILESDKLKKYIDDLVAKYPEKYLEIVRFDLSSITNFNKIVSEMDFFNVDESGDTEEASDEVMETIRSKTHAVSDVEDEPFDVV